MKVKNTKLPCAVVECNFKLPVFSPARFIANRLPVLLKFDCRCCSKSSLQEPCQIVKPEDSTLLTGDYWLRLAEQLESERSTFHHLRFLCTHIPDITGVLLPVLILHARNIKYTGQLLNCSPTD